MCLLTVSEDLWVLVRITDPVVVEVGKSFHRTYGDFTYSNATESRARLTSFASPSIQSTSNFTHLLEYVNGNNYTRSVWDRDVTLVLLVSNLSNSTRFRITVEQPNFLFLLYFFATFITYVLTPLLGIMWWLISVLFFLVIFLVDVSACCSPSSWLRGISRGNWPTGHS